MSSKPNWDEFRLNLLGELTRGSAPQQKKFEQLVVNSDGLQKALEAVLAKEPSELHGLYYVVLNAAGIARQIISRLALIQSEAWCQTRPELLVKERLIKQRRAALDHLRRACQELMPIGVVQRADNGHPEFVEQIMKIHVELRHAPLPGGMADLNDRNFATKGKPSFNTFAIRELSPVIPEESRKRDTAIAELLALVDVHVTPQAVTRALAKR